MKRCITTEAGFWNPRSCLPLIQDTKPTASEFPHFICYRLHHKHEGFVFRRGQKALNGFKGYCFTDYIFEGVSLTLADVCTCFPLISALRKNLKQWTHFPLRETNIEHKRLRQ